ncbi:MAG: MFS transporter [Flavobacteriaceae bacterium]|nr:MFS transporter [Flavobacteriaceae bacterium]
MTDRIKKLGLKENLAQFILLIIINAFVGGMVGIERTIIPQFATDNFNISSKSAILSFIIAFGITKAFTNYVFGKLANSIGRKKLLIIGWLFAIPVPLILINANFWIWVIFANILLGINQGLTWSSTINMKIDLVGEKDRGFAMGLNEFSGYLAVGITAYLSGYIANKYGITPYPFYIGFIVALLGLLTTILFVKETRSFINIESKANKFNSFENVFIDTTFKNKTLSSVTQAGLINNLNDGMIWGLLPILLLSINLNTEQIGLIAAAYPTFWGIGQLFTGRLSDFYSKKRMLFWGMLIQGISILFLPFINYFFLLLFLSILLGIGTAIVYPTFLNVIAEESPPLQRAESIGVFRLWRDLGYAIGAIISGITADLFGLEFSIILIGLITIMSSIIIQFRMPSKS